MNLGRIKKENESFIEEYKEHGFATKTELANAAFDELRRKHAKKRRATWRAEAFEEYAKDVKNLFESIDADPFHE